MRHEFTNFTRGSQLLGHFGFMFAAGLKGPLLVTAAIFAGLIWWRASSTLSDHEAYLRWMRVYAWIYGWFEFDPDKAVNLDLASGGHIQLSLSALPTHPLLLRAWGRLMAATGEASALAACISIPAIAAFAWVAAWFGRRSKESRHERGATLAELPQLATEIAAHNRVKRADEYRHVLGWSWRLPDLHAPRGQDSYCMRIRLVGGLRHEFDGFPGHTQQDFEAAIAAVGIGMRCADHGQRELTGH